MNAVRAEWTKLRTTPGPRWLLLVMATVTVALGAAVSAAATCPPMDCARLALSGVYLGQAPIAVLAVLTVSGEFSTALIRTTLTAVPSRPAVLAAKALVLTAAVAAAGTLTLLAALLAAGIVPPVLPRGPMLRATGGSVAYLALIALLSLGIAAVVRDSAAAIGTVLGLLYLPPVLTQMVTDPQLHLRLEQIAPMSAGLSIQATTDLGGLPIGPWPGLGVLAAWSAGSLLVGTVLLHVRDT
jgi:ABC-2 type transport system permease protein